MRTTTPFFDRGFLAGLSISASLHAAAIVALSYCVAPRSGARPPPVRTGEHSIRISLLPDTFTVSAPEPVAAETERDAQPSSREHEEIRHSTFSEASPEILALPPRPVSVVIAPPLSGDEEEAKPLPPEPTEIPDSGLVVAADSPPPSPPGLPDGASLFAELSPHYPRRCRRLGHEGTVHLEVEVSASGRVASVRVVSSAGCEELDESAITAVRTAQFQPATLAGRAVPGAVVLPVAFRLE